MKLVKVTDNLSILNPLIPAFGMFNAADMWNFTGTLFTTSLNNAFSANKIVNKFKLFHIYNRWDDKDILKVLEVANTIDVITEDEEDAKEFWDILPMKSDQRTPLAA